MKPKYFPYIPIMANEIFLEGNKGKIYGRNREKYAKIGKISRKEPGWVSFYGFFPQETLF
jgi:hypothetical protein